MLSFFSFSSLVAFWCELTKWEHSQAVWGQVAVFCCLCLFTLSRWRLCLLCCIVVCHAACSRLCLPLFSQVRVFADLQIMRAEGLICLLFLLFDLSSNTVNVRVASFFFCCGSVSLVRVDDGCNCRWFSTSSGLFSCGAWRLFVLLLPAVVVLFVFFLVLFFSLSLSHYNLLVAGLAVQSLLASCCPASRLGLLHFSCVWSFVWCTHRLRLVCACMMIANRPSLCCLWVCTVVGFVSL